MSILLIGLIGAMVATNQLAAASNLVEQATGISVKLADPNDAVENEYKKLEEQDDAAMAEVDGWIRENQEFAAKGAGIPNAELNRRIRSRLALVRAGYEDFIKLHPKHVQARIAFASFLDDTGDEDAEFEQLEIARKLDPKEPSVWNNLGNYYGHTGPIKTAFEDYEKAIALNPNESVYYQNFGTAVYLFRKDAKEYYHIDEQHVFDKAMMLYSNAMRCDPTNFELASDVVAQSYYGIRPLRTNDALQSWTNALALAHDEHEREGVYVHLARVKMIAGMFSEAREQLNAVTNAQYADLKKRILRNLNEREHPTSDTNNPHSGPAAAVSDYFIGTKQGVSPTNAAPKDAGENN